MLQFQSIFVLLCILTLTTKGENVTINPGDNIQDAINKVHSGGGGTVIFNNGTYIITESLIMYSKITLQGNTKFSPSDIIITVDPKNLKYDKPLITSNTVNMRDLNFINLKLMGNIQPSEQKYPAYCLQCSRNCTGKNPSDPGCSCLNQCPSDMRTSQLCMIMIADGTTIDTAQNIGLLLKDLEVSHCSMGIHLKGWRNVRIENLNLFNNGMIQEYFHNMYLRRDFNVTISGLNSHDSPTGNGINISQSSYIIAYLSKFFNNYWRGLRIEGEDGYVFHNINVYNNTSDGDGDYGFRFANGYDGVVENNVAKNNTPTNLYKANLHNITFINNDF